MDRWPQLLVSGHRSLCAFCSNMRAADCTLSASARCCEANQRVYSVGCPRHAANPWDAAWSSSSASSDLSDEVTAVTALGLDTLADLTLAASDARDDRCTFCSNQRAADCALGACRTCCLARLGRCERHGLDMGPADPDAHGRPADEADAAAASPVSGLLCSFCSNRRAAGCALQACRSCCLNGVGPCEWHAAGAPGRSHAEQFRARAVGGTTTAAVVLTFDECCYCPNRAAAGCSQHACRPCCVSTMLPCARHRL